METTAAVAGHYGKQGLLESILDALRAAGEESRRAHRRRPRDVRSLSPSRSRRDARAPWPRGPASGRARHRRQRWHRRARPHARRSRLLGDRARLDRGVLPHRSRAHRTSRPRRPRHVSPRERARDAVRGRSVRRRVDAAQLDEHRRQGRLYGEIARVVRRGGKLAMHEIMAGPEGPPHFPVPWASVPTISFLRAPDVVRKLIGASGFLERAWQDVSAAALAWLRERLAATPSSPAARTSPAARPRRRERCCATSPPATAEEHRIAVIEAVFDRD